MDNIVFYIVIGLIVSMDAMALTVARESTYTGTQPYLAKWAALNAAWHGGLLLFYMFILHLILKGAKDALSGINYTWLLANIPKLADEIIWFVEKLKIHFSAIFATITIIFVWLTYSKKVIDTPLEPKLENTQSWIRHVFRPLKKILNHELFADNLQAAIVAVDMLALAAMIKATNQTTSTKEKLLMTLVVSLCVFLFTLLAAMLARKKLAETASKENSRTKIHQQQLAKIWILITLRLAEPLFVFYFLLQLLAWLATGIHMDSIALWVAASLMVAAIIETHGLTKIIESTQPPRMQD